MFKSAFGIKFVLAPELLDVGGTGGLKARSFTQRRRISRRSQSDVPGGFVSLHRTDTGS
jgi:hypothetical protein